VDHPADDPENTKDRENDETTAVLMTAGEGSKYERPNNPCDKGGGGRAKHLVVDL
jgi:hypothetical protein